MTSSVSVVVPCHDHGHLLGEALDSVQAQGVEGLEVVVVDDHSSDDTVAVATARGVRVVPSRGSGAGAARNTGVAVSSGAVLAFLDADDVWPAGSLSVRLAMLADRQVDGVAGAVEEFVDARGSGPLPEPRPASVSRLPGSLLVTRRAWDLVGPIDESLGAGEFIDWVARFDAAGLTAERIGDVVLRRRIHATNSTRRGAADVGANLLAVARRHRARG